MTVTPQAALSSELRALAERQWRDYVQRTPGTYFRDQPITLTLADAYQIQIEMVRLRCEAGDTVAGYKVGCVGEGVVQQFGMSGPIHARIFRSELRPAGACLSYDAYANLAIEGEMAVRIGADGQIDVAFPIIELHHFIFHGHSKTLVELVANNGINGGVVLPDASKAQPLAAWKRAQTLSVTVDGREIDRGSLWSMSGGAIASVAWLQEDLARHGLSLKEGDLVLTATPLGLHPVKPGNRVSVLIDGLECVSCEIE
jgi:2-keto-4-pentenoate hydratase